MIVRIVSIAPVVSNNGQRRSGQLYGKTTQTIAKTTRATRLSSIQVIEVVSVARVVCDRLDSLHIIVPIAFEHYLKQLGRSYRNQAFHQNFQAIVKLFCSEKGSLENFEARSLEFKKPIPIKLITDEMIYEMDHI